MKHISTFENFLNEGVKWKPSRNENVDGFVAKSFPHGKKGDALLSREEFIKKWDARIESWIGVKPNLAAVKEFFTNNGLNFEFVGADGYTYRIYSPGEGPRSKEYHIQKLKKLAESELFLGEGNYSLQNIDDTTVEEFEKDWNRGSKVSGLMKLIKAATGKDISDIPEKAVEEFDKIVGGGIKASPAAIKILDVLNKYA